MPRSRFDRRTRPRSVWFALGTGVVGCCLVAALILFPLLSLIGASAGAAWFVDMPLARIGVVVVAGCLLAAGLLALSAVTRRGATAWILAVAAVVATLVVSLYPAVAVASTAVDQAGDVIPFITEWVEKGAALIP